MESLKQGINKVEKFINELINSAVMESIRASIDSKWKLINENLFTPFVESSKQGLKKIEGFFREVSISSLWVQFKDSTNSKWKLINQGFFSPAFESSKRGFKRAGTFLGRFSVKSFVEPFKNSINSKRKLINERFFKPAIGSLKQGIKNTGKFFRRFSISDISKSFKHAINSKWKLVNERFFIPIFQSSKQGFGKLGESINSLFSSGIVKSIKQSVKTFGKLFAGALSSNKNFRNGLITIIVLSLLLIDPFGTSFAKSMNKQEFFLYHVKDLFQHSFAEKASAETGCYLATKTYENQLEGDLFGVSRGKNLIVVQMESVQSMVIGKDYNGQEITPVLNEIIGESGSIYFDNFYCQIGAGNTSDAEFAVNNSLFGSIESYTYQLFENNYFYGLPKVMIDEGYGTAVFHGYKKEFWNRENIYPNLGFQRFYSADDYESDNIEGIGGGNIVGISDEAFLKQTVEKMGLLEQPFYGFTITLSNHNPFGLPDNLKKIKLDKKDENIFGNYLNAVHYGDYCLGEFMEAMKEQGLYENSIFVFYGDHYGLTKSDSQISSLVSEWLGEEYTYDEMNRVPMLVHIPGNEVNETISVSGGQLDLFPTIAYLMGIEQLNTLYLGQNLFTAEVGFVPIQMHMLKGSFIMNDVVFQMSRDGIFKNSKAWDRITKEPLDAESYYVEYQAAKQAVEVSEFYLYNDIMNKVLVEGRDLNSILNQDKNSNALPKKLSLYTYKYNSDEEIDDMARYLKLNKKEHLAIDSDNLYTVLSKFEELYSGKRGVTGSILYVDEVANEEFLEMRSRIIPVMNGSTNNYSKLEYLGYHNIIISPERSGMTLDELNCFVESNDVAGFLLVDKTEGAFFDLAMSLDIDLFELRDGFLRKR